MAKSQRINRFFQTKKYSWVGGEILHEETIKTMHNVFVGNCE